MLYVERATRESVGLLLENMWGVLELVRTSDNNLDINFGREYDNFGNIIMYNCEGIQRAYLIWQQIYNL